MRALAAALCLSAVLCISSAATVQAETVESIGDARIDHDIATGRWRIAAGGASMVVTIDPAKDYAITSLRSPSGTDWMQLRGPDAVITVDGVSYPFGSRSAGFTYDSVATHNDGRHLELVTSYVLAPDNLLVTRHITVVSGSPTFETWLTFQALGNSVLVSNLDAFQAVLAPGTLHWLTGHEPEAGDTTLDSVFARENKMLGVGESLKFGSIARSSEQTVPWMAIENAGEVLYSSLMWSGAWSLTTTRTSTGLAMDFGLGAMTTAAGATPIDGPHALVGVVSGSLPEATAALGSYIIDGIRNGRALTPLVTYNTWFAYGTRIDEASMRREMSRAASMGVELFVIDAGWYVGADASDPFNFTPGLGTWEIDPGRFPNGLKVLTDYAHSLGMKFGVWVEPERVSLSALGHNGLDESALAKAHGTYQSDDSGLVCLAGKAGRQWVLDRVSAFIDAVQPDYLKWDNNLWLDCEREGHGHLTTDGNFAHVTALYEILNTLRQRYPNLTIENCSAGGNRLDLGMMRYTDTAWMDDHTSPSVKVRHNIEGLSLVFPPAYLLSFITNLGWEPLHNSPDLSAYLRSRMEGVLGLCFQSSWLSDNDLDEIAQEIDLYKSLRPTLAAASAALLTPQARGEAPASWDVLQVTAPDGSAVVYAFDAQTGASETTVTPVNLLENAVYRVISADSGPLGEVLGTDLMEDGVRIVRSPETAAHVLSLTPQP